MAALLVAQNAETHEAIAAKAETTKRTLTQWKAHPDFQARVEEHRTAWRERLHAERDALVAQIPTDSIADRNVRVTGAIERHQLLQRVIDARATYYTQREADGDKTVAPGAATGLLASRPKPGKFRNAEEYRVDVGMLKEMRELEVQVAKDLGQWEERTRVDVEIRLRSLARELGLDEDTVLAEAQDILRTAKGRA